MLSTTRAWTMLRMSCPSKGRQLETDQVTRDGIKSTVIGTSGLPPNREGVALAHRGRFGPVTGGGKTNEGMCEGSGQQSRGTPFHLMT